MSEMTSKLLLFSAEIIIFWAVLFAAQFNLRKKEHRVARTIVFILKLLLIPASALLFVAIECRFSYAHGDIICALYVALIGDCAASIIEYLIRRLGKNTDQDKAACKQKLIAVLSLVFCAAVTIYGALNAWNITMRTHEWTAKGLTQEHTFAFAADLHTGSAQTMDTLREFVDQVNDADPEFVILGGDVVDELTSHDEMLETFEILSKLEAPTYFIYGNHDRQPDADYVGGRTYTDEELVDALKAADITILSDEYIKVKDDIVLLGREDISRKSDRKDWKDIENPYEGEGALIVADHQPYDKEQLAEIEAPLQLSGHTHAGQMFPLQLVYKLIGIEPFGEFKHPGVTLFVTAGESDWMMPLRTEAHCEWELITIKPE